MSGSAGGVASEGSIADVVAGFRDATTSSPFVGVSLTSENMILESYTLAASYSPDDGSWNAGTPLENGTISLSGNWRPQTTVVLEGGPLTTFVPIVVDPACATRIVVSSCGCPKKLAIQRSPDLSSRKPGDCCDPASPSSMTAHALRSSALTAVASAASA